MPFFRSDLSIDKIFREIFLMELSLPNYHLHSVILFQ